ncbi:MAG: DUF6527 family protein [Thermoguttaceae bacterium]|jgi:hypothetical protein
MKPQIVLRHEFVEFVPDELNERTLYVSIRYRTVVHLCCCGCGRQVVTPLSPTAWSLTFDGVSISLYPSIGSWNLPCRSHYWIERNRAKWSRRWSQAEIEAGRASEARAKAKYYGTEGEKPEPPLDLTQPHAVVGGAATSSSPPPKESVWRRMKKWLFRS